MDGKSSVLNRLVTQNSFRELLENYNILSHKKPDGQNESEEINEANDV